MKHKTRWALLGLLGLCAVHTVGADDFTSRDARNTITVTVKERNQVLFEMRELLHGLYNLNLALSKNDFQGVSTAAKSMSPLMQKVPDSMKARLPEPFMQLALAQRESFEILARNAEAKKDHALIVGQIAESVTYCSGCHDTYRFEVNKYLSATY